MIDINKILCTEFNLKPYQVENTVKLIDEGIQFPSLQGTARSRQAPWTMWL